MWTIRDSDGSETLHSIYPGWADGIDHLTVTEYLPKAQYDAVVKELADVSKQLAEAQKFAKQHMSTVRSNARRMRETEACLNKYYAIIQQHGLYLETGLTNDPIINVKV